MSRENVIDFKSRRQLKSKTKVTKSPLGGAKEAAVVDMTERRAEMITQERRLVRRTLLTEFIGAFTVVPSSGLLKVALYDISENGISFDIDPKAGGFQVNEEVAVRVYLNQQTYFPFIVKILNVRFIEDEGVVRHGGNFVKGTINDLALHHFVKFIETVSASLEKDGGDIMVSNLNGG